MQVGEVYHGNIEVLKLLKGSRALIRFKNTGFERVASRVNIIKDKVKDLYSPTVYGKGYVGEGPYNSNSTEYVRWTNVLKRCYCTKERCDDSVVVEEWLNFQTFARWVSSTYPLNLAYEQYELDKDLTGGRIYSPATCNWLPKRINNIINIYSKKINGLPVGVFRNGDRFIAQCISSAGIQTYIGSYSSPEEAHAAYKIFKKKVLVEVATEYFEGGLITEKVRDLLINYKL